MKSKKLLSLFLAGTLFLAACGSSDDPSGPSDPANVVNLANGGTIEGNYVNKDVRLAKGTYTLKGYVYLSEGSKITIPAGTIIKSDVSQKGALIVERNCQIIAEGTASEPIVFTSGRPVGQRNPGDWGGIILLGNAPTNRTSPPTIEGGVGRQYGGSNATDNSGTMKYVRIEFAGIAAEQNSEINGLTLGGVGSGTTLDYIQTVYANDDAFEFFGGTVNAKHLVAYASADDDLDFDFGYTGKIQYAVSLRNPAFADPEAANGIECDNDGTGTTATPRTKPVLSNLTLLGPNNASGTAATHNFANRWRRATQFVLGNSVLLGWQKGGLSFESADTYNDFIAGTSIFSNNVQANVTANFRLGTDTGAGSTAAAVQAKAEASGSVVLASPELAGLTSPFALTAPNFLPTSASVLNTGATFTGALADGFFDKVAYKGAFGTTNWLSGWTDFNFTRTASGY